MARITIPVGQGNRAISEGRLGALMLRTTERWRPEAMYFTTFSGERTAYLVFDLADPSDIPSFAEPFFTELNAGVEIAPVMNPDDLVKGLSQLS
jgi:hypothetical protein